jgi:hypothetical protein
MRVVLDLSRDTGRGFVEDPYEAFKNGATVDVQEDTRA